jgi:hypothetical protein
MEKGGSLVRYGQFSDWIDSVIVGKRIDKGRVIRFDMYEYADDVTYSIDMEVGDRLEGLDFDVEDFPPKPETFFWFEMSPDSAGWENALDLAQGLLFRYLEQGTWKDKMKDADMVVIGFVNGGLKLLYPESYEALGGQHG